MKRKDLIQLALTICSFSEILLHAQQKRNIRNVDPIIDFRTPCSLLESLHEGISFIHGSLQSGQVSKDVLQSIKYKLIELSSLHDNVINTTRNHQINDEDKAYLQKMIDRINLLINTLESDNQEDAELVDSVRSLCHDLNDKVS